MKTILKSVVVLGTSLLVLAGCGNNVDFKSAEDRATFDNNEIAMVEESILEMEGVASFEINRAEGGVYATLVVEDRKDAKDLAVKSFNAMWAETTGIVDLFVKEKGEKDHILIQAFKPAGTDEENKWLIMY